MKILLNNDYCKALDALKSVAYNTLFIRAVLDGKAEGRVYTDCRQNPSIFYVVHEYGMSLLYGQLSDDFLINQFSSYVLNDDRGRVQKEWMQIHPVEFEDNINKLLNQVRKDRSMAVRFHRRINFKFNNINFRKKSLSALPLGISVAPISEKTFNEFGALVIPRLFWKTFSQFESSAKGFELREGDLVVAVAFSAFITSSELELGMEVHQDKRKLGYGILITAQLIDYCMANMLIPVWSCNFANKGSYNLAQKLGFEPRLNLPYYELLP